MVKKTRSAGGVVLNSRGQVLVVNQKGTSWSLPKGHVDPGEDDLAAARREIREETGLTRLEFVAELGSYERARISATGGEDASEIKTIKFFLFRTDETHLAPQDEDNPEARWVDKDKVAGLLTHPKDKQFFVGILNRLGP